MFERAYKTVFFFSMWVSEAKSINSKDGATWIKQKKEGTFWGPVQTVSVFLFWLRGEHIMSNFRLAVQQKRKKKMMSSNENNTKIKKNLFHYLLLSYFLPSLALPSTSFLLIFVLFSLVNFFLLALPSSLLFILPLLFFVTPSNSYSSPSSLLFLLFPFLYPRPLCAVPFTPPPIPLPFLLFILHSFVPFLLIFLSSLRPLLSSPQSSKLKKNCLPFDNFGFLIKMAFIYKSFSSITTPVDTKLF